VIGARPTLKLAVAVEAKSLDAVEDACVACEWMADDLLPPLVVDLRAMVATPVA
jgi:hypothetical protein